MLIAKKLFNFLFIIATMEGKYLTIQQITEEFKYHDKQITYFFLKKKTEQNNQLPKTNEPHDSCSSQANAHNAFTLDLLP